MSKQFYQLQERTFLNANRDRVVAETDPEAAHLLGPKGFRVPLEQAKSLGLVEEKAEEPSEDKVQEKGEDKSQSPSEDKSQSPAENKGQKYDEGSTQYQTTMTILLNNDVDLDHLPNMLDADLLAIDGISRTRLQLIRDHFPAEDTDGDSDNS